MADRAAAARLASRPSRRTRAVLAIIAALLVCIFLALGTWQVERRAWKLDLIERVNARVHAPPSPAPGRAEWPSVDAASSEYRHVSVTGQLLDASEALVQAVTDIGPGFWVLTPLRQADGSIVFINRGYVPADRKDRAAHDAGDGAHPGPVTITGLLRMPEPGGGFLRRNDAAADKWYSRDVQAIAAARGLGSEVAPYFIDADAAPTASTAASGVTAVSAQAPIGGLTVITFHNSHLVYVLTWYALALGTAWGAWLLWREPRPATAPTPD